MSYDPMLEYVRIFTRLTALGDTIEEAAAWLHNPSLKGFDNKAPVAHIRDGCSDVVDKVIDKLELELYS